MAVYTHAIRFTPVSVPANSEKRVIFCNGDTDEIHCAASADGHIGYYVSGSFVSMGTNTIDYNNTYSIIVKHDTVSGAGAIYLQGQKLGQVSNFPKSVVNQIGNAFTALYPSDDRYPSDDLFPRDEGNPYTLPANGDFDDYVGFNRALAEDEIVDLAQNGLLSKVYTLADYYLMKAADDGFITPTEKPAQREKWTEIWNGDQRTTPLPTVIASITVDGSYRSLAIAANQEGLWTPTTNGTASYNYYLAVDNWRKMFFDASVSGFLLTAQLNVVSDISTLNPSYDARLSALKKAENDLLVAISNAQANARAQAAQSAAADDATAKANAVNETLTTLSNSLNADDNVTPIEKSATYPIYAALKAEKSALDTQADSFEITTEKTNYDNAITSLVTFAETTYTIYANFGLTTTLDSGGGALFRSKLNDALTKKQALLNKIALQARSLGGSDAIATMTDYAVTYAPKYLGRYHHAHPASYNNGDWWLVYSTYQDSITYAKTRGFWYSNNGTPTLITTLPLEAQRKYRSAGLEDVLYASNNGFALTSTGVYDPVAIYGVSTMEFLAVNQAFIQKLMVQELTLKSTGKIKSENFVTGESGFQLQASDGSAEFNDVKVRGTVYSGERYNQDGSDKNTSANGYWLGPDGTMKAENGFFSGVLGQEKKITIKDYFISMFTSNSFTNLTKKLIAWGAGLFWYKYNTTTASWDSIASLEANPMSSSSTMKATGVWLFNSAINGSISADPYKINGSYTHLGLYNMLHLYGASINVGETILATGFMRIGSGRVVVSFLKRNTETGYTIYGYDTYSDGLYNSGNGFSVSSISSDSASGVFVLAW